MRGFLEELWALFKNAVGNAIESALACLLNALICKLEEFLKRLSSPPHNPYGGRHITNNEVDPRAACTEAASDDVCAETTSNSVHAETARDGDHAGENPKDWDEEFVEETSVEEVCSPEGNSVRRTYHKKRTYRKKA